MNKPRIILFCGGKFSFPSIQILVLEKFLAGIVIASDDTEVIELLRTESERTGLPFLAIRKKQAQEEIREWLGPLEADALFSICYPFLIPEFVLNRFGMRAINFHPGPLPGYRGPMPIYEVIRAGEPESAIAVHVMNEKFDDGPIILQEPVPIDASETYGSLAVKLSRRTALVTRSIAEMLEFGTSVPTIPQQGLPGRFFPKPDAKDLLIRWKQMNADEIVNLVKACNPWSGGALTFYMGAELKIVSCSTSGTEHNSEPGTIISGPDCNQLEIACIENQKLVVDIISDDCGIRSATLDKNSNFIRGRQFGIPGT